MTNSDTIVSGRPSGTGLTRSIGARIRAMREGAGMTQTELAEAIGYRNPSSITFIEQGEAGIKADVLILLCTKLNTSPNELFGWVGSPR